MDKSRFFLVSVSILILFSTAPTQGQVSDSYTCQQPDPAAFQVWSLVPENHTIAWRLDHVCSTFRGCYGYQANGDTGEDAQLCPVAIQTVDRVFLTPPPSGSPYKVKPVNASLEQFIKCPVSSDQTFFSEETTQSSNSVLEVPQEYLIPGRTTYLAQATNGAFSNCTFGLRVKIQVKDNSRCISSIKSSESTDITSKSLCSGNGQCVTTLLDADYYCVCDNTHTGDVCERETSCITEPCSSGSTCVPQGDTSFTCACPVTRTGRLCDVPLETCETKECLNGGYCLSTIDGIPICHCPPGWTEGDCNTLENPCVTKNPCNPGQLCVDTSTPLDPGTYNCTCPLGYEGEFCEVDIDECRSSPCQNEGVCTQGLGHFNCTCLPGFTGVTCKKDVNVCATQTPCQNEATCIDGAGLRFTCQCVPGYTGKKCENEVNECETDPCLNGGTCRDLIGRFECLCRQRFYGDTCELKNGCHKQDCENGGVCQRIGDGDYFCECAPGYTGEQCGEEIDECLDHLCENGASCVDLIGSYRCECTFGYTGDLCEVNINDCLNNLCQNGATCEDLIGTYSCSCSLGYTGELCGTDIDDCDPDPCVNGLCQDKVAGYTCFCDNGFMGETCDQEIDECLEAACVESNTDNCEDGQLTFTCVCKQGYSGKFCEVDNCSGNECQNNATCINTDEGYRCQCASGFTSEFCETEVNICHHNKPCYGGYCISIGNLDFRCMCPTDKFVRDEFCRILHPCEAEPCKNGAFCTGNMTDYTYTCICAPGYEGDNCELDIHECQVWNITCEHGLCFDKRNDFLCGCQPGYTGRYCEVNIDDCEQNECLNNSFCLDEVDGYSCDCQVGFSGRYCNETFSQCAEEPCQNGATCITVSTTTQKPGFRLPGSIGGGSNVDLSNANPDTFRCECAEGFEGIFCEKNIDDCDIHHCKHGGTCVDGVNGFTCLCTEGFTGENCKHNIDDCGSHKCQNNGTCKDMVNQYRCICPDEFTGEFCEEDVDECVSDPCQNSGICVDGVGSYKCYCRNGFTGPHCENDYDECVSSPCRNGGNCTEGVGSFTCDCDTGWSGLTCEMNINECSSGPCYNGATCSDRINGFDCECSGGFSGKRCEVEIDECESFPCDNGGFCRDIVNGYICDCPPPYSGTECQLLPCDLNPCGNRGSCSNELSLEPHGFVCTCLSGFTGLRCQGNIDDCVATASSVEGGTCSGRGFCVDLENSYTCYCDPGWKGQDCELPIDQCTGQDKCRNGGTCVNRAAGFLCECTPGWDGDFCERNRDDCESSPCRFDATCVDLFNDYQCLCSPGWMGEQCTEQINECLTNPCGNQATCVDLVNDFTCLCPPLYTGRLCESVYDPCAPENNVCQHSATCSVNTDGTYSCKCAPGYRGIHCEVDINECDPDPCVNSAPCEDMLDGFMCHCPPGFTGETCAVNIDDCEGHFCENSATCSDLTNGYYCECADGWSGVYCTQEVNECLSDPCLNNAECQDGTNGYTCLCPVSFTGVHCEESIDQCSPSPCLHGSVCKLTADAGYACYCGAGYQGTHCETEIDECDTIPCMGNGECTDLVNDYTCDCYDGWSGRNCTDNIDECVSSPCQNQATCVDGVNGYTCSCVRGYAGAHCELEFDHCDPNPCLHDGTCQYSENSFTCDCLNGTTGYQCETDLNECAENPCGDRGICREFKAGYGFMCLCNPGLGGDLCEVNYDDCTPNPCHNGGTCEDFIDAFSCSCPYGFSGQHCEVQYNVTQPPSPSLDTKTSRLTSPESSLTPTMSSAQVTSMNHIVTSMHAITALSSSTVNGDDGVTTSVVDGTELFTDFTTTSSSMGEGHLSSMKVTHDQSHDSFTTSQPDITTPLSYSSSSDSVFSVVESTFDFVSSTTGVGNTFSSSTSSETSDSSLPDSTFSSVFTDTKTEDSISTDKSTGLESARASTEEMLTSAPGPLDDISNTSQSQELPSSTSESEMDSRLSSVTTAEVINMESSQDVGGTSSITADIMSTVNPTTETTFTGTTDLGDTTGSISETMPGSDGAITTVTIPTTSSVVGVETTFVSSTEQIGEVTTDEDPTTQTSVKDKSTTFQTETNDSLSMSTKITTEVNRTVIGEVTEITTVTTEGVQVTNTSETTTSQVLVSESDNTTGETMIETTYTEVKNTRSEEFATTTLELQTGSQSVLSTTESALTTDTESALTTGTELSSTGTTESALTPGTESTLTGTESALTGTTESVVTTGTESTLTGTTESALKTGTESVLITGTHSALTTGTESALTGTTESASTTGTESVLTTDTESTLTTTTESVLTVTTVTENALTGTKSVLTTGTESALTGTSESALTTTISEVLTTQREVNTTDSTITTTSGLLSESTGFGTGTSEITTESVFSATEITHVNNETITDIDTNTESTDRDSTVADITEEAVISTSEANDTFSSTLIDSSTESVVTSSANSSLVTEMSTENWKIKLNETTLQPLSPISESFTGTTAMDLPVNSTISEVLSTTETRKPETTVGSNSTTVEQQTITNTQSGIGLSTSGEIVSSKNDTGIVSEVTQSLTESTTRLENVTEMNNVTGIIQRSTTTMVSSQMTEVSHETTQEMNIVNQTTEDSSSIRNTTLFSTETIQSEDGTTTTEWSVGNMTSGVTTTSSVNLTTQSEYTSNVTGSKGIFSNDSTQTTQVQMDITTESTESSFSTSRPHSVLNDTTKVSDISSEVTTVPFLNATTSNENVSRTNEDTSISSVVDMTTSSSSNLSAITTDNMTIVHTTLISSPSTNVSDNLLDTSISPVVDIMTTSSSGNLSTITTDNVTLISSLSTNNSADLTTTPAMVTDINTMVTDINTMVTDTNTTGYDSTNMSLVSSSQNSTDVTIADTGRDSNANLTSTTNVDISTEDETSRNTVYITTEGLFNTTDMLTEQGTSTESSLIKTSDQTTLFGNNSDNSNTTGSDVTTSEVLSTRDLPETNDTSDTTLTTVSAVTDEYNKTSIFNDSSSVTTEMVMTTINEMTEPTVPTVTTADYNSSSTFESVFNTTTLINDTTVVITTMGEDLITTPSDLHNETSEMLTGSSQYVSDITTKVNATTDAMDVSSLPNATQSLPNLTTTASANEENFTEVSTASTENVPNPATNYTTNDPSEVSEEYTTSQNVTDIMPTQTTKYTTGSQQDVSDILATDNVTSVMPTLATGSTLFSTDNTSDDSTLGTMPSFATTGITTDNVGNGSDSSTSRNITPTIPTLVTHYSTDIDANTTALPTTGNYSETLPTNSTSDRNETTTFQNVSDTFTTAINSNYTSYYSTSDVPSVENITATISSNATTDAMNVSSLPNATEEYLTNYTTIISDNTTDSTTSLWNLTETLPTIDTTGITDDLMNSSISQNNTQSTSYSVTTPVLDNNEPYTTENTTEGQGYFDTTTETIDHVNNETSFQTSSESLPTIPPSTPNSSNESANSTTPFVNNVTSFQNITETKLLTTLNVNNITSIYENVTDEIVDVTTTAFPSAGNETVSETFSENFSTMSPTTNNVSSMFQNVTESVVNATTTPPITGGDLVNVSENSLPTTISTSALSNNVSSTFKNVTTAIVSDTTSAITDGNNGTDSETVFESVTTVAVTTPISENGTDITSMLNNTTSVTDSLNNGSVTMDFLHNQTSATTTLIGMDNHTATTESVLQNETETTSPRLNIVTTYSPDMTTGSSGSQHLTTSLDSQTTDSSIPPEVVTSPSVNETTTVTTSSPVIGSCEEGTCHNGGLCVNISSDGIQGYRCECPVKYYGTNCQYAHSYRELSFTGHGFLTFPAPRVGAENTIELSFQTIQEEGLILYTAKDVSAMDQTQFLKLYIEEGIIKYIFSCAVETFTINTLIRVNTGQIFNVIVRQRSQCKASVSIEGDTISHQTAEQGLTQTPQEFEFTAFQKLFIGGVPGHVTQQPDQASNFIGCVNHVTWNGQVYGISKAEDGQNIEECVSESFPTQPPTAHPTCADVSCQNGGSCENVLTPSGGIRYQCSCPIHYTGTRCEEEIVVFFPRFSGNSYLQYEAVDLSGSLNDLYLTFKTGHTEGTLLYTADDNGRFIHLFVEEGILKFQMTCGMSGIIYMNSQTSVDIDQLVEVQLRLEVSQPEQRCFVSMAVGDNDAMNSTLFTAAAPVAMATSDLYLGGAPVSLTTVAQATPFIGFTGCIRHLQINEKEKRVFHDADRGVNIDRCEVNACDYNPCMNRATCEDTGESWYCQCTPGYTGTYCERDTCHFQPCLHGGTCLHVQDAANYLCLCPYGRHGVNCSQSISVFRPSFNGIQYGYPSFMAYPRIPSIDHVIDIKFSFSLAKDETLNKNASESSLMIYTGQKGDGSQGSDFLVVGLEAHHIVFRFDCGSGAAEIRSLYPISSELSVHHVTLGRNKRFGWLRVDGQSEVTGLSRGSLSGLNVDSMFYVGGHDYYGNAKHLLPDRASFMNTFHGCIFDVEVRAGRYGEMGRLGHVTSGRNVQQCDHSECEVNVCHNGASCVDLGSSFGCNCTEGFVGQLCTDLTSACDGNHSCSADSVCVPLSEGGYECDCPLGKTGVYCQQNIILSDPNFIGERSYMAFHTPRNIRENLDIKLQFKSTKSAGLLLYMAETLSDRTSDFLSIELVDWSVVLRYNTGSENPTVLTSENKADHSFGADYWYTLYTGRNTTHAYLNLDGKEVTKAAENGMTNLDISTLVYLGGLPDLSVVSPYAVDNDVVTFEGCVRELVVNHVQYRLDESGAVEGLNVEDCDGTACGLSVCQNGGTCQLNSTGGFTCQCVQPFTGLTCRDSVYCTDNQCSANSLCVPHDVQRNYSCLCPLGQGGFYCDQEITINIPYFSGIHSYVYIHDDSGTDLSLTDLAFNFLTVESEGMILWNGEVYSDKDDYLGVGIHRGRLRVLISLGWWVRDELFSMQTVNDGFWHTVSIQRNGRVLTLTVDGVMSVVTVSGTFSHLNTNGHFHLGGFEYGHRVYDKTNGHFSSPFIGALANLRLYKDSHLVDWRSIGTQGANIVDYVNRGN